MFLNRIEEVHKQVHFALFAYMVGSMLPRCPLVLAFNMHPQLTQILIILNSIEEIDRQRVNLVLFAYLVGSKLS